MWHHRIYKTLSNKRRKLDNDPSLVPEVSVSVDQPMLNPRMGPANEECADEEDEGGEAKWNTHRELFPEVAFNDMTLTEQSDVNDVEG